MLWLLFTSYLSFKKPAETDIFATSSSNLVPIGIGKQITDPILTNEKVWSAKWLASFGSSDFKVLREVR